MDASLHPPLLCCSITAMCRYLQSDLSLLVSQAAHDISRSCLRETERCCCQSINEDSLKPLIMMHCICGSMPCFTLSPSLPLCFLQVMYSQDKHSHPSVVETNTTSLELSLPVNQDYVIQIKPFSEGGEGSSSQITIPKIAGGTVLTHDMWKLCLCVSECETSV